MATKLTVGRRPGDRAGVAIDAASDAAKRRAAFLRLQQEHLAQLRGSTNPADQAKAGVEGYIPEGRRAGAAAKPRENIPNPIPAPAESPARPVAPGAAIPPARPTREEAGRAEAGVQTALDPSKLPQNSQDYLAQLKAAKTRDEKTTLMTEREVTRAKTLKDLEDAGDASRARANKIIHDEERRQEAWEKDRTPPEGAPEDVKGTFSALSKTMRQGVRSITNPEGTTPAGAYTALFGAASGNRRYALGVAGGDLGPNPALAGQRAGERARGENLTGTSAPVMGFSMNRETQGSGGPVGPGTLTGENLIAPRVTDTTRKEDRTNKESVIGKATARANLAQTRAKDALARSKEYDGLGHEAAKRGDTVKADWYFGKAKEFQTEGDTQTATAERELESVKDQPAGVRTTKKIMARTGLSEDQASRIMQYGDIGPGSAARRAPSARVGTILRGLEAGTAMTGGAGAAGQGAPLTTARAQQMAQRLTQGLNDGSVSQTEYDQGMAELQRREKGGRYGPQNITGATNFNPKTINIGGLPHILQPDGRGGWAATPITTTQPVYGPEGTPIGGAAPQPGLNLQGFQGSPQVGVGPGGAPGAGAGAPATAALPVAAAGEPVADGLVAATPAEIQAAAQKVGPDRTQIEAELNANGLTGQYQRRS